MAQLRPGDLLEDRYRITQILRTDDEAVTAYLAEDTTVEGSEVAITEVVDTLPSHAWRLAAEGMFQASLPGLRAAQHTAVIPVSDSFNVGRRHYLVMEHVPGEVLQAALDASPGRPAFRPEQVLDWAIQLCSALQALHGLDPPVILRDLSPSGLLLTEDGTLKLADFGFTRIFLTSNVQTLAAPGYAPPEQYARAPQPPNPQSDIYALGATLHYLLTGRDPGLTPFLFPDAAQLNPAVSPALARVVAKAVALEPAARYSDAHSMLVDLRAAKQQPVPPPPPVPAPVLPAAPPPDPAPRPPPLHPRPIGIAPKPAPRQNAGTALLAGLAVLLLLVVAAVAFLSGSLPGLPGAATPGAAATLPPTEIATPPAETTAPATATVPLVVVQSPVAVITFTPTAALPATTQPTPPTITPPPSPAAPTATAGPASATATPAPAPPSPTSTPAATQFGVVQESAVNVRATPGATGAIRGQANRGDLLDVLETRQVDSAAWYRVPWTGQDGWIVGTYLKVYDTRTAALDAAAALKAATPTPAR